MILTVTKAIYLDGYKIELSFNSGETKIVDLEATLFNDRRKIFEPLRNIQYFKNFSLRYNTITWDNEADFAPEYLYDVGEPVFNKQTEAAYTL